MSVNRVTLIGRLGVAPELRQMPNGGAVATLRLATTETWKDQAGQRQERTEREAGGASAPSSAPGDDFDDDCLFSEGWEMNGDEMRRVEALLRLWGEAQRIGTGRGAYPARAGFVRAGLGGAAPTSSSEPLAPEVAEVMAQALRVDRALDSLAPTLRRLLLLKFKLGHSDLVCRQDVRFKGMSEEDFRMLKRNALELLALRLRARR